jgi:predicted nucleic acid-binding protein
MDLASQVLLLIDEREGRALARELGLRLAGTAAVIGLARQRRLILGQSRVHLSACPRFPDRT